MFGEKQKKVVYLGGDHAGFAVKSQLDTFLRDKGFETIDLGVFNEDPADYPDIAREVGEKVFESPDSFGILICGSGVGISIAANKVKGVRAALCTDEGMAETARKHNDANVLSMGARHTDLEMMKKIAEKFVTTDFEKDEERHVRRVNKIKAMDGLF